MKDSKQTYLEETKSKVFETLSTFEDMNLDKNKFCVMPFVNIILEPTGDVGICRHKGTEFTFGNIRNQTIDEIWSSPKVQAWRKGHLDGNAQVCKTELVDRKCNLCPELNTLLADAEITNIKNPKILRLTANLNGKCNLQCQMCHVWKLPNGFYTEENFWIPARERFFKDILEVDMLSGEPFIQSDTYRLIDEVVSVNPECQWTFTTNLHWKLTEEIKQNLDKIIIKNIITSIDSLDEVTYKKIRYPGKLSFVLSNLDSMIEYQSERVLKQLSKLNIRVHFLIQKDNWMEVKEMIAFCFEKKVTPFISFLYEPESFCLLDFSQDERIKMLNYYFDNLNKEELLLIQRILKPLIRSLDKLEYAQYLNLFHEKITNE
jgi:radical SAM protein with 4Fe4S-binding SPASM domain